MSLLNRLIGKFRRKPTTEPIAKAHNGVILRPGMRIRFAIGGETTHRVNRIIRDDLIEVRFSDGVFDTSNPKNWIPVRRRHRH